MPGPFDLAAESASTPAAVLKRFSRLERDTWTLVRKFYASDLSPSMHKAPPQHSHLSVISEQERRNTEFRLLQLIVEWLEETYDPEEQPLQCNVVWDRTRQLMGTEESARRGFVTKLDPDAPAREDAKLHQLDQDNDNRLVVDVWNFMRAGQLDTAREYCRNCGQHWRAASLGGRNLYHVDVSREGVNIRGNQNILEWKKMCEELSTSLTRHVEGVDIDNADDARSDCFQKYERAIYAILAGKFDQAKVVCTSWEDYFWGKFKCDLSQMEDLFLQGAGACEGVVFSDPVVALQSVPAALSGPDVDVMFHEVQRLLVQEFQQAAAAKDASALNNAMGEVIRLVASHVSGSGDSSTASSWAPLLARFGAHLSLFAKDLSNGGEFTDEELVGNCDKIIRAHVSYLVDSDLREHGEASQAQTIARFCDHLSNGGDDIYVDYLVRLSLLYVDLDNEVRRMCYSFAVEFFGEDRARHHVIRNVLQSILQRSKESNDVTDDQLINSIQWQLCGLTAEQDGMYRCYFPLDALRSGNAIIRWFLFCRNGSGNNTQVVLNRSRSAGLLQPRRDDSQMFVEAAQRLMTNLIPSLLEVDPTQQECDLRSMLVQLQESPFVEPDSDTIEDIFELTCWYQYCDGLTVYWQRDIFDSSTEPRPPSNMDVSSQTVYLQHMREFEQRKRQCQDRNESAARALNAFFGVNTETGCALPGSAGWIKARAYTHGNKMDEDDQYLSELQYLAQECIPECAFSLHNVYFAMGEFQNSLLISHRLADNSDELYQVFKTNDMVTFVNMMRESAVRLEMTDPI